MFSINKTCPHCFKSGDFVVKQPVEYIAPRKVKEGQVRTREMQITSRMVSGSDTVKGYAVSCCPKCQGPLLIWFTASYESLSLAQSSSQNPGWIYKSDNSLKILDTYPERKTAIDSPHWPEKLRLIFIELQEDMNLGRMPERIVSGCRSVMEVALKELDCGKAKDNIFNRIDTAREKGLITESLKEWVHRVRLDGNEAIHELEATSEEAQEAIAFITLFMEVAFDVPNKIPSV